MVDKTREYTLVGIQMAIGRFKKNNETIADAGSSVCWLGGSSF